MDVISQVLQEYSDVIFIVMGAMIILLGIIVVILFVRVNKIEDRYLKLIRGTNTKNLENTIVDYFDRIDETKEKIDNMCSQMQYIDKRIARCVQKMAIMRYQAFNDVGSDLSYSIALLDYKDNGVILTSIYGRNESTSYAKPIDKGISRYALSEEEEEVLEKAINNYSTKYDKNNEK